jgi:hypothetical protein
MELHVCNHERTKSFFIDEKETNQPDAQQQGAPAPDPG